MDVGTSSMAQQVLRTDGAGMNAFDRASVLLFAAVIACVFWTFRDYGIGWDDRIQHRYGERILDYYATGGEDDRALVEDNLYLYGGLVEVTMAAAVRISPWDVHDTRRLIGGWIGVLGLVAGWWIGRQIAGPPGAFAVAAALALTPEFGAASFVNSKDAPFATGYLWTIAALIRFARETPRPTVRAVIACGVAIGATSAIRVGGLVALGYVAVIGVVAAWRSPTRMRTLLRLTLAGIAMYAIAIVVMLPWWPWIHANPLTRPIEALLRFSSFSEGPSATLFGGAMCAVDDLPLAYVPVQLGMRVPEWLLVAGLVALPIAVRRAREPAFAITALAALFPLGWAIATSAPLYNGLRQLAFATAAVVVLLAGAAATLRSRVFGAAIAAFAIVHIATLVRLHPHETAYHNRFVGGAAGAVGVYSVDYWRMASREAIERLVVLLEAEAGGARPRDYTLFTDGDVNSIPRFYPPWLHRATSAEDADFIIESCDQRLYPALGGRVLVTVERDGAVLCLVRDRRGAPRVPPAPSSEAASPERN